MTPGNVYFGRLYEVVTRRAKVKRMTLKNGKRKYLAGLAARIRAECRLLARAFFCPIWSDDIHWMRDDMR